MRTGWRIIGVTAGVLCALNAVLLVGFSVWEVAAPDSVESSGPSPWLVLTPWIVGLFLIARWSLRRAARMRPGAFDRRVERSTRALDGWAESHPVLVATVGGGVLGVAWSMGHGLLLGLGAGAAFAAAQWLADRLGSRRRRGPANRASTG